MNSMSAEKDRLYLPPDMCEKQGYGRQIKQKKKQVGKNKGWPFMVHPP
jgi:hypothetical protein